MSAQEQEPLIELKPIGRLPSFLGVSTNQLETVLLLHVILFLYSINWQCMELSLPYILKELGENAQMFGFVKSGFNVVAAVGAVMFGSLARVVGIKKCLTIAVFASAVHYALVIGAVYFGIMFLLVAQLPTFVQHIFQSIEMIITHVTTIEQRAYALGRLGISYSMGVVVGPLIAMALVDVGMAVPLMFASAMSLICVVAVQLLLPAQTEAEAEEGESKASLTSMLNCSHYIEVALHGNVYTILLVKFFAIMANGCILVMFTQIGMQVFVLSEAQSAAVMSFNGLVGLIGTSFLAPMLIVKLGDVRTLQIGLLVSMIGEYSLMFANDQFSLGLSCVPVIIGKSAVMLVTTTKIIASVPIMWSGTAIGMDMLGFMVCGIIMPPIAGWLLDKVGLWAVCCTAGTFSLISLSLTVYFKKRWMADVSWAPVADFGQRPKDATAPKTDA